MKTLPSTLLGVCLHYMSNREQTLQTLVHSDADCTHISTLSTTHSCVHYREHIPSNTALHIYEVQFYLVHPYTHKLCVLCSVHNVMRSTLCAKGFMITLQSLVLFPTALRRQLTLSSGRCRILNIAQLTHVITLLIQALNHSTRTTQKVVTSMGLGGGALARVQSTSTLGNTSPNKVLG
jgi:hypothetical protein